MKMKRVRENEEREKVKGEERYRREKDGESFSALSEDGESFSALSGWNNWHFMWKDPGSLGSLFTPITLLFTPFIRPVHPSPSQLLSLSRSHSNTFRFLSHRDRKSVCE